jgi:hypothetical protein
MSAMRAQRDVALTIAPIITVTVTTVKISIAEAWLTRAWPWNDGNPEGGMSRRLRAEPFRHDVADHAGGRPSSDKAAGRWAAAQHIKRRRGATSGSRCSSAMSGGDYRPL